MSINPTPEGPEAPAPEPIETLLAEAQATGLERALPVFVEAMLKQQRDLADKFSLQTFTDGAGRIRTFKCPALVEITDEAEPNHKFNTLASFIRYALQDAKPDLAAVFVAESSVDLILNRKLAWGSATWPLAESEAWKRWVGKTLNQAEFADLLEVWGPSELVMPEAARLGAQMNLEKLSISKAVKFASTSRNGQLVSLAYSVEGEDPGSANLPLSWTVKVPRHNGGPVLEVQLRLKLQLSESRGPSFTLECPRLAAYKEEAFELAVAKVQEGLPGFLVFRGSAGSAKP